MRESPVRISPQAQTSLTRLEVLDRISRVLEAMLGEVLHARSINENTGLLGHGMGLDSIEVLGLVAALEEEFALTIDDSELDVRHFATVGAVLHLILPKLLGGQHGDNS
jgi:acyl carrier protein